METSPYQPGLHDYLHCYNRASVLIEEGTHLGQKDPQPLVHSRKVIWKTTRFNTVTHFFFYKEAPCTLLSWGWQQRSNRLIQPLPSETGVSRAPQV